MSTLIFGLTRYYLTSYDGDNHSVKPTRPNEIDDSECSKTHYDRNKKSQSSIIIFAGIYVTLLAICTFISKPDSHIFVNWSNIEATGIIQLGAAIMLCFFMPGYAVLLIMNKRYKINPLLTVLLAYLISMLITGIIEYISASSFDTSLFESKNLLIGTYVVILVVFIINYPIHKINSQNGYHILDRFLSYVNTKLWISAKSRISELLVFGSLFMLLIVYSYYIFGAITIGDQWFHQGRALLFMSGSFRQVALSGADDLYPPFQSAFLASLTTLSGIPLVNTYASIAFTSIIPVFAFYYFFTRWVPLDMQRAKVLASSLFATSSGFGWIYLLGLTVTTNPIVSEKSVVATIASTGPYTFDIVLPVNFILAAHPDINTGLIYIAIPAGFVLLGLLRGHLQNNFTFTTIVAAISILGILSHDEFYFFILVGSVLPLIFRVKQGNYLYLGLLFAFLIVYVINLMAPEKYYTSNEIFGIPLLILNVLFVSIAWALYLTKHNLHKVRAILTSKFRTKQLNDNTKDNTHNTKDNTRLYFVMVVLLISVVVYIYGLSFIVWTGFSMDELKIQTSEYNVPWYLYPMKFGITGLLALTFVLSYLFRRFEKELFVFGIIIVIALLTGPYYDEHRFSKYVMVGMVGFASLLVYKILNLKYNKPIVNTILIGAIITSSSLSTLMFLGYNSLILQTQELHHTLGRRNFPTTSEMHFLQVLHDKTDLGSKRYNVVTFPNEYNYIEGGLIAKLQAFSGLPNTKLYQSPLTLNVSTLDAFYHLLEYSGTRYIIIPKASISQKPGLTEPILFALDHFQRTYEDNEYIVLDVPDLKAPSSASGTDIALVYNHNQKDETLLSDVSSEKLLQYDKRTFYFGGKTNFVINQKGNQTLSVYNSNKTFVLRSKDINPSTPINYIELGFRIIAENGKRNHEVGLKWYEGDKEYYLSLSENGLELSQKSRGTNDDNKILYQNVEIEKKDLTFYTVKVETLQNSINIFLDDMLRIQAPRAILGTGVGGISQVAISASNSTVEFGLIKIGNLSEKSYGGVAKYSNYYYPLTILALSTSGYDIFTDQDLSALSKKEIILTFDPSDWHNNTFNRYLEYVNKGGTLVVINSDNFKGRFGQLFSVQANDNQTQTFTKISGPNNQFLSISGIVKQVHVNSSKDVNIISTYSDEANRVLSPLAIEKHFSNGGRIILVNNEGYFNALSKSPLQYFLSLSNISKLLDLDIGKSTPSEFTSEQATRFIGEIEISGNVTLKSSSLLLPNDTDNSQSIHAERVSIASKSNSNSSSRTFNNVIIKDLKLMGQYEIKINSTGTSVLSHMGSQHEYIDILTPVNFNMTINLSADKLSSAGFIPLNSFSNKTIQVNNDSVINFYNITAGSVKSIPILLKSPEVRVNGHLGFKGSNFDPSFANYWKSIPLDAEGWLNGKLGFVDNYVEPNGNGTRTKYITYIQSLSINRTTHKGELKINLPGDISDNAKQLGLQIPLKHVLLSSSSLTLLISISIVTVIGSLLLRHKIKYQT